MKIGDLVKNTCFNKIGVIVRLPDKSNVYSAQQVLVATSEGQIRWWIASMQVLNETR